MHLLLISEQPTDRQRVAALLEPTGPDVSLVCAEGLVAGLAHLSTQPVDLVLLAATPSAEPLLDMWRTVNMHAPALPVILLLPDDDPVIASQALREGAQDCLELSRLAGDRLLRAIRFAIQRERATAVRIEGVDQFRLLFERNHANDPGDGSGIGRDPGCQSGRG